MNHIIIQAKPAGLPVPAQRIPVLSGKTVLDIVLETYGTTDGIEAWLPGRDVLWEPVPKEYWGFVRPRKDDVLRFTFRPHGGGKGNLFATVAAIALAVIAPGIGTAISGALFGGSALAASLIGAGVAIGGSLLLAKLFPSDLGSTAALGAEEKESGTYQDVSSDSNVLAKGAYLPLVVGQRRFSPPDVMQPRAYLEDGIDTIDRCLALDGKHSLTEIRVDGTPADSIAAITTETKDGDETTGCYTFIDEISVPVQISEELSTFSLDGTTIEDQETPSNSEPRWHAFSVPGHEDLEEIAIRIRIDGLATSNSATQKIRIPFRIRFREKGSSTWINVPELHLIGRDPQTFVRDIRFRWDAKFGSTEIDGELEWEFWGEVPAADNTLSDGSSGSQWQANDYFVNSSISPPGYQDVVNISAKRFGARIQLDTETFPKGEYEFQIQRGIAVNDTALDSNYEISSVCHSLFVSYDSSNIWSVPVDQGAFLTRMSALQATAIADRYPVEWPKTAIIALKAKGVSVRNVTVKAARYVYEWDGSGWNTETATSKNPATHYRQLLYDFLTEYGISTDLIDNDSIVAWRAECAAKGYECSAVFAGETILECLSALATAGFARPRFSDGFGIDYFRDRSADTPVQTFSPRNTSSIIFDIVAPERPFGYRVSFQNEDDEWRDDEIEVAIDNAADIGNWEAISYKAISKKSLAVRRGYFDLLQVNERRRQWNVETAIEGVACEIGDLVSLVTDLFDDESHGARIRQVIDSTHIVIDQEIPAEDPGADIAESPGPTIEQVFTTSGERSLAFIHTESGVTQHTIEDASGSTIVLASAISDTDNLVGSPINITTLSNASHRCFVVGIERLEEERARLTLVDEAPQIVTKMNTRFR